MSETISQPYLVAALVNKPGRRPEWSTFPAQGIWLDPGTQSIYEATFGPDGTPEPLADDALAGNPRHNGLLLPDDKRSKTHVRGTEQFNRQAVSLITMREIGYIATLFGLDKARSPKILEESELADEQTLKAARKDLELATALVIGHALGANMIVGGLAEGERLQVGDEVGKLHIGVDPKTNGPRSEFRGAVFVTGVNQPCPLPGALLARLYDLEDPKAMGILFEEKARDNRGHVAQIVEAGIFKVDDPLLIAPYRS